MTGTLAASFSNLINAFVAIGMAIFQGILGVITACLQFGQSIVHLVLDLFSDVYGLVAGNIVLLLLAGGGYYYYTTRNASGKTLRKK